MEFRSIQSSQRAEVSGQWNSGWEQCGDDVESKDAGRKNIVGLGGRSWILRVFYSSVYMSYSVFHLSLCLKMYVLWNIL